MRVLVVSEYGDFSPVAQHMIRQGDRVEVYITNQDARVTGHGLTIQPPFWQKPLALADVQREGYDYVIFDNVRQGNFADKLRESGTPVVGASRLMDALELDRHYGIQIMRTAGIKVPPTHSFAPTEYSDAIKLVEQSGKRYVYKPCGNQLTSDTYVAEGPDDLVAMLHIYSDLIKVPFILQEYISGTEVSTEVWFNGSQVVNVNSTMEEKHHTSSIAPNHTRDLDRATRARLHALGMGVYSGCAGNVVWNYDLRRLPRLYQEGIGRAVPFLRQADYRGVLDLNAIVNEEGIWGLEWTARFGYDAIYAFLEGLREPLAPLLSSLARGVDVRTSWKDDASMTGSVRLTVPPFPHDGHSQAGIPILGVDARNERHVWLCDARLNGRGSLEVAGFDGNVGSVSAFGTSVSEVRRRIYRTVTNLTVPEVVFRPDIGLRVRDGVAQLQQWGYLEQARTPRGASPSHTAPRRRESSQYSASASPPAPEDAAPPAESPSPAYASEAAS